MQFVCQLILSAKIHLSFLGQLLGRLRGSNFPEIADLVKKATEWRKRPWLCPLRGSLIPAGGALIRTLSSSQGGRRVHAVRVTSDEKRAVSALKRWDPQSMGSNRWRGIAYAGPGMIAVLRLWK